MHVMSLEQDAEIEKTRQTFKMMMIAGNIEHMELISRLFDEGAEDLLSEDELEDAKPMDAEEIESTLDSIRSLGYSFLDG